MQERYSTPASRPPKRQHALTINLPQLPVFCHPRRPSVHLLANSCHSQIDIHWTSTFEWFGVRPMTRVGRRKRKLGLLATPAVTRRGLMGLPRVYFFCSDQPGDLQEDVIALAEGFAELGIPFFANCNYWLQSTDPDAYLFRHTPD